MQSNLDMERIKAHNLEVLNGGPDSNCKTKLKQLKLHESLHQKFEQRELKPNLLSYYLKKMQNYRNILINHLQNGQALPDNFIIVPCRLGKIPLNWKILADRGFFNDAIHYPNCNAHVTPTLRKSRPQFEPHEISADRKVCELRYTCEVVFSRITNMRCLMDVCNIEFMNYLTDAIHYAHAFNNLQQPLQLPIDWVEYINNIGN